MSNYSHQGRYAGDYDSKSTPATLKPHRKHTRTSHDSYQVVDPASKRLFFLSLFVLLESWKIYDAIALKSSKIGVNITSLNKFTFVVKYFLLEGIFFWTLPYSMFHNCPSIQLQHLLSQLFSTFLRSFSSATAQFQ